MKEIRVLISAIGHSTSPGVIEAIKNNGEREVKVIGVDMDPTVIISVLLLGIIRFQVFLIQILPIHIILIAF